MSLFPAYAPESANEVIEINAGIASCEDVLLSEPVDEDNFNKEAVFYDEIDLLKSDSSPNVSEDEQPECKTVDDNKKKKKKKRKHERNSDEEKHKKRRKTMEDNYGLEDDLDFYIDRKHDYGNLNVSTIYMPGRPQYNYIHCTLGELKHKRPKKTSTTKRYFNAKIKFDSEPFEIRSEKVENLSADTPTNLKMVEKIADSGIEWNDNKVEKNLVEKTEYFNKYLNDNPYDISMWVQYIKFQEDRYTFDVCNERAVSESTARSVLHSKQLSIIDKCLEYNPHNKEIVTLKVKISEQSLPNDQYMSLLKIMISESGVPSNLLCKLWLWYIEGVQCSMALCSVPCVKDMYAGAVKALSKGNSQKYQSTHVEMLYLFGLFLRQCGLWEQLWLLLKLNIDMNLAVSLAASAEASLCFVQNQPEEEEEQENEMLKQEAKIISSGLPLHSVWWRCVRARGAQHWRPALPIPYGGNTPLDPQRLAYPSDLLDLLEPVTKPEHLFKLAVNIIRLLKIPILPLTNGVQEALHTNMGNLDWDVDQIEQTLVFVYAILDNTDPMDDCQMSAIAKIMADFVEQPTYFEDSNGFLKFVNDVMLNCANWFSGKERTALHLWWIRFQRVLLALNRSNTTEGARVRKQVQKVLKANRSDILLYSEFAALEADLNDRQRAIQVLHTSLTLAKPDTQILHTYLSRSYVKLLIRHGSNQNVEDKSKAITALVSLANGKSLPGSFNNTYDETELSTALQQFADKTDTLLMWMSSDESPFELVDLMYPNICVEWICCHGWFLLLTEPSKLHSQFYNKIMIATTTDNSVSGSSNCQRIKWIRENFMAWYNMATSSGLQSAISLKARGSLGKEVQNSLEQYPFNASLVWSHVSHWGCRGPTGRWQLYTLAKASKTSQLLLAIAMVFGDFISLYERDDPNHEGVWQTGHTNRLHHLLQTFTKDKRYRRCALLWKWRIYFDSVHSNQSQTSLKNTLYLALDECPWNKDIYSIGCTHQPSEFSELIDLMMEKQIRLHAMPEELQPL